MCWLSESRPLQPPTTSPETGSIGVSLRRPIFRERPSTRVSPTGLPPSSPDTGRMLSELNRLIFGGISVFRRGDCAPSVEGKIPSMWGLRDWPIFTVHIGRSKDPLSVSDNHGLLVLGRPNVSSLPSRQLTHVRRKGDPRRRSVITPHLNNAHSMLFRGKPTMRQNSPKIFF